MTVSLLLILALSFSSSTAFAATTNTSNTSTSHTNTVTTATNSSTTTSYVAAGSAPSVSFSSSQINDASSRVNTFINTNGRLPSYVTMGSYHVTMPQFLQLAAQNLVNINSGSTSSVTLGTVNSPSNATVTVKSGTIYKTEYVTVAKSILSTITNTHAAPSYVSSSIGNIKFDSLVDTFSKILNFQKTNSRLPNYVSVSPLAGEGGSTIGTSVQATLDAIGYAEAKFRDVQGQSSASVMQRVGYGDCWADSEWLYNKLNAAGIAARIMGYIGGGTGAWYRHAWVQINIGSGWVNWNYAKYGSQHHGDGLGAASYVLIAASNKIVDVANMVATGY